jgi:hypothetical protein
MSALGPLYTFLAAQAPRGGDTRANTHRIKKTRSLTDRVTGL